VSEAAWWDPGDEFAPDEHPACSADEVAAWAAAASLGTGLLTPWGVLDPAAPGPYDLPEVEPHVDVGDTPPY
jgi:hypothetical protein